MVALVALVAQAVDHVAPKYVGQSQKSYPDEQATGVPHSQLSQGNEQDTRHTHSQHAAKL